MIELLRALKLIQKTCKEYDKCDTCPLGTKTASCNLAGHTIPEKWNIKDVDTVRLFEDEIDW